MILPIREGLCFLRGSDCPTHRLWFEPDPLDRPAAADQATGNCRFRDNEEGGWRPHGQPGPCEVV